jgi:hypothetical protein
VDLGRVVDAASAMARRTPSATVATISGRPMCSGRITSLMATPTVSGARRPLGGRLVDPGEHGGVGREHPVRPARPHHRDLAHLGRVRVPCSISVARNAWSARMRVKSLTPPLPSVLPTTATTPSAGIVPSLIKPARPEASLTLSSTTLWAA